jgi:hypothetical protein
MNFKQLNNQIKQSADQEAYSSFFYDKYAYSRFDYYLLEWLHYFQYLWCDFRGHKLIDVGVSGPESGEITLECKKCGCTLYHETLY